MMFINEKDINEKLLESIAKHFEINIDEISYLNHNEDFSLMSYVNKERPNEDSVIAFTVEEFGPTREELQLDILDVNNTELLVAMWVGDYFVEEVTVKL